MKEAATSASTTGSNSPRHTPQGSPDTSSSTATRETMLTEVMVVAVRMPLARITLGDGDVPTRGVVGSLVQGLMLLSSNFTEEERSRDRWTVRRSSRRMPHHLGKYS